MSTPDVLADHTPSMHALWIHTKSSRHSNALHPKQVTDKYLFAHASLLNASTHSCKISVASYVLMELDFGWQRLWSSRCCQPQRWTPATFKGWLLKLSQSARRWSSKVIWSTIVWTLSVTLCSRSSSALCRHGCECLSSKLFLWISCLCISFVSVCIIHTCMCVYLYMQD